MHRSGCIKRQSQLIKKLLNKTQYQKAEIKFSVLREDPPAFPWYWKAPTVFLEKSLFLTQVFKTVCSRRKRERGTAQFYTPVWLQAPSPIPKCLLRSRTYHLKWKPRQNVWFHFSMEFSHYFSSSVHCNEIHNFFLSLFYLLTSVVLGKHASQLKQHLPSLATILLFFTPQKASLCLLNNPRNPL